MSDLRETMELVGTTVDLVGVVVIVVGAILAAGRVVARRVETPGGWYRRYRQGLGRSILLGLEFLVAGDIIRTVAVAPTLENVSVLGLIVLIRTFLSFALEVELEGHWPWHRGEPGSQA